MPKAYYPVYPFDVANEILKNKYDVDLTNDQHESGYTDNDVNECLWPIPELAVEVDVPLMIPNAEAKVATFIGFPPRMYSETMPLFIKQDNTGSIRVYIEAEIFDDTF